MAIARRERTRRRVDAAAAPTAESARPRAVGSTTRAVGSTTRAVGSTTRAAAAVSGRSLALRRERLFPSSQRVWRPKHPVRSAGPNYARGSTRGLRVASRLNDVIGDGMCFPIPAMQ